MNKVKIFLSLITILFLTGCTDQEIPTETTTETKLIDFMSEHKELSNFLYNNIDNSKMNEEAISLYECGFLKSYAEKELNELYYCEEIFDDFNGDGKEEMLVIRDLTSDAPHMLYYDIWHTDGKTCRCIYDNTTQSLKYTYVDNTFILCDIETVNMGSSKQYAQCFIVNNGTLEELTGAEGRIVYGDINDSDFCLGIEKDDEYYNVKLDGTTLVIAE